MTEELSVVIAADGETVEAIYDDRLLGIVDALGGTPEITRASHVEPHPDGGWVADMRPVGGSILGSDAGFTTRAEALAEERAWLRWKLGL